MKEIIENYDTLIAASLGALVPLILYFLQLKITKKCELIIKEMDKQVESERKYHAATIDLLLKITNLTPAINQLFKDRKNSLCEK